MQLDAAEIEAGCGRATASKVRVRLLTLDELDGRTSAARLVRELIASIENDLGGAEALTEGQRQLVQRAAVLGAMIEDSETRWIGGAEFDAAAYLAQINAQRRVLATIGLERRTRDVTPSLAHYIAAHDARAAVAEAARHVAAPPG
jgi:hypothetical protein